MSPLGFMQQLMGILSKVGKATQVFFIVLRLSLPYEYFTPYMMQQCARIVMVCVGQDSSPAQVALF